MASVFFPRGCSAIQNGRLYHPGSEGVFHVSSPDLAIPWPLSDGEMILSKKTNRPVLSAYDIMLILNKNTLNEPLPEQICFPWKNGFMHRQTTYVDIGRRGQKDTIQITALLPCKEDKGRSYGNTRPSCHRTDAHLCRKSYPDLRYVPDTGQRVYCRDPFWGNHTIF